MRVSTGEEQDWGAAVPLMSEDALLLAETTHRIANELMAATAAMRLALLPKDPRGRSAMVRSAIERLEGFGEVLNVLNVTPGSKIDVASFIERMCRGLCAARFGYDGCSMILDLPETLVEADVARRLMMITSELIHNCLRHAFDGRRGTLSVSLRNEAGTIHLMVADDGPGLATPSRPTGRGMGGPIVAQLVDRGAGTIHRESSPTGTTVRIALPLGRRAPLADSSTAASCSHPCALIAEADQDRHG
jgi:two-component sensor histidine kinase